jgi:hypothetical protein
MPADIRATPPGRCAHGRGSKPGLCFSSPAAYGISGAFSFDAQVTVCSADV